MNSAHATIRLIAKDFNRLVIVLGPMFVTYTVITFLFYTKGPIIAAEVSAQFAFASLFTLLASKGHELSIIRDAKKYEEYITWNSIVVLVGVLICISINCGFSGLFTLMVFLFKRQEVKQDANKTILLLAFVLSTISILVLTNISNEQAILISMVIFSFTLIEIIFRRKLVSKYIGIQYIASDYIQAILKQGLIWTILTGQIYLVHVFFADPKLELAMRYALLLSLPNLVIQRMPLLHAFFTKPKIVALSILFSAFLLAIFAIKLNFLNTVAAGLVSTLFWPVSNNATIHLQTRAIDKPFIAAAFIANVIFICLVFFSAGAATFLSRNFFFIALPIITRKIYCDT